LHEPKLNGYRLQVIKDGPEVRLYSRNGHDWSKHPAILTDALLNRSLGFCPTASWRASNRERWKLFEKRWTKAFTLVIEETGDRTAVG
jgi:hypothetical protein